MSSFSQLTGSSFLFFLDGSGVVDLLEVDDEVGETFPDWDVAAAAGNEAGTTFEDILKGTADTDKDSSVATKLQKIDSSFN